MFGASAEHYPNQNIFFYLTFWGHIIAVGGFLLYGFLKSP